MGIFTNWCAKKRNKEITNFTNLIMGMNCEEREDILKLALNMFYDLVDEGVIHKATFLNVPFDTKPAASLARLHGLRIAFISKGNAVAAGAIAFWIFSIRGMLAPEDRRYVREFWGAVIKGNDHLIRLLPDGIDYLFITE